MSAQTTHNRCRVPPGKTPVELYADFLKYLSRCIYDFIREGKIGGEYILDKLLAKNQVEYIIPHPNGWEFAQQKELRQAAVLAGLIPNTYEGHNRLHFVTEGEASLHFCIEKGLRADTLAEGVIIVDAGGGTIDISAYSMTASGMARVVVEEVCPSECKFAGSTFITERAQEYIKAKFARSPYEGDVQDIVDEFDKKVKPYFRCASEKQYIKCTSVRDNDPNLGIFSGQLHLSGAEVANFFEPSVQAIIQTVFRILKDHGISTVCLVGGLAASDWLFTKLKECFQLIVHIYRPDAHVNKAAADGGISFFIDHFVSTRVSRFTYGVACHVNFKERDPEHRQRRQKVIVSEVGKRELHDAFDVILQKGTRVSEETEFRRSYYVEKLRRDDLELNHIKQPIHCYEGSNPDPHWWDIEKTFFRKVCTVTADASCIEKRKTGRSPKSPGPVYRMDYDIVLLFGGPELKAQLCWVEEGEEKRSPAEIIYNYSTD
ncbi:hypothetical protein Moror_2720 [Moniliophthora roreri MCA 2997]|uniref:Actin-like ATPase domain-containing protein n=1 Tax=Moniliophthora roreri (strain MCA 2997) TaxID=1381753 RepID=V2WWY9_MONRO|nr:hypothetical protein Moror_2720 [Moniliophthora roreri MCA 2997]